ncbi:M24 family metallopeptidase [Wenzhouxiangella marina]|uniref:Xaa-Pro aminopeptidase n=1 Tax=Wenzhouxiangella marina TaxID=1579979 RepID=A0A0K0XU57_9GAMM|nr:M24 family metallopeptidase [Wenzhouxiangella marina]AKS41234.1 Xaa-Pro aminopeptidase [Wenzhouxiangella marina]MBB6088114.1 Xaa-Pro aminopeptidase [Wenzhouxiangella marina]
MIHVLRARTAWLLAMAAWLPVTFSLAQPADQGRVIEIEPTVLAERDRIEPENRMVADRLEHLLPGLMAETGIDMWLVINREYAEDPVYFTLVPQPSFAARRTTMLVFDLQDDGSVDRLSVNRYPLGEPYQVGWSGGDLEAQWQALGTLIAERDPERIGINVSSTWPEADGLTHGLHQKLMAALPEALHDRVVSAEDLVVRWMETRSEMEQAVYPHVVSIARRAIEEAFSSRTITPGVTTTDDVAWAIRDWFESRGLRIWFMPYVNIQRPGQDCEADTPFCGVSGVIQPGDVLHTDVGICYLKLCTDTQEMGYVLKMGESEVPEALVEALAEGNRWQDLLTDEFVTGRTGNEILMAAQASMANEPWGFNIYTHPIGFVGHAPGPTIGMWDLPAEVANTGDWPLYPNTAYAIEGNVAVPLAEWNGQHVQIKLEQSAIFDGERVIYLAGRQTEWHVVR